MNATVTTTITSVTLHEFLTKLLPTGNIYCAGFANPCTSIADLVSQILQIDVTRRNAYFALATFAAFTYADGKFRSQPNAVAARSFWLDIDVGADKAAKGQGYENQNLAIEALVKFGKEVSLPKPMIVDSGGGYHVYWPMTDNVPKSEWQPVADKFKTLATELGFLVDQSRTADIASVLRPIGTHNKKPERNNAIVTLVSDAPPTEFSVFRQIIESAYEKYCAKNLTQRSTGTLNAEPLDQTTKNLLGNYQQLPLEHLPDLLSYLDPNMDRSGWIRVLFAVAEEYGEGGREVACEWSATATRIDEKGSSVFSLQEFDKQFSDAVSRRGKSSKPVTMGSLIIQAKAKGWIDPRGTFGVSAGGVDDPEIDELNAEFFVAPYASTVAIFRKNDKGEYTPIRTEAFKLLIQNRYVRREIDGESKMLPAYDFWLRNKDRKQYKGVSFCPGRNAPAGYFNLWQGWAVEPRPGDVTPALNHIENVLADDDTVLAKYLVGWMANMVQNPYRAGEVALVFQGCKGIGKTILTDWMKRMFGIHSMSVASAKLVTGEFTGHLEKLVLLVAEEAFWAGSKDGESQLKHMLTGERLLIHPKGYTPYEVQNCLHMMIISNEDWVIPASVDERRFCVCKVSDNRKGDRKYFDALGQWADHGGVESLLHYLLHYDLKGFNVRVPPDTLGLKEQKLLSFDHATRAVYDWLEDCDSSSWSSEVSVWSLTSKMESAGLHPSAKRRAETQLGILMPKIFPGVRKERRRNGHLREHRYVLKKCTLTEARGEFERYSGLHGHDWGTEVDEGASCGQT